MVTEVINLGTGQRQTFTLPPTQAVVNAWHQSQRDWNTWEYEYAEAPIVFGKHTVACGDFCVLAMPCRALCSTCGAQCERSVYHTPPHRCA